MNIEEYRAMKAAEAAKPTETEPTTPKAEEVVETPATPEEAAAPPTEAPKIKIGDKEYDESAIKELESGYLRTQDYTQKTQEAARIRRENAEAIQLYEYLKANPKIAEVMLKSEQATPADIQTLSLLDPQVAHNQKIERELNDLRLSQEIDRMQAKYDDFDVLAVLQVAHDKRLNNLEDAYAIVRGTRNPAPTTPETPAAASSSPVDVDALRKQIMDEVLEKIAQEGNATKTIITSNGGKPPAIQQEVQLTDDEKKIADKLRLPYAEYSKWKNKK